MLARCALLEAHARCAALAADYDDSLDDSSRADSQGDAAPAIVAAAQQPHARCAPRHPNPKQP